MNTISFSFIFHIQLFLCYFSIKHDHLLVEISYSSSSFHNSCSMEVLLLPFFFLQTTHRHSCKTILVNNIRSFKNIIARGEQEQNWSSGPMSCGVTADVLCSLLHLSPLFRTLPKIEATHMWNGCFLWEHQGPLRTAGKGPHAPAGAMGFKARSKWAEKCVLRSGAFSD